MLPALLRYFEDTLGIGRYWTKDGIIELADPEGKFWAKRSTDSMYSRIITRSASSKGGLEALTAKGAWLDECGMDEFGLSAWDAVQRRLSIHEGRVLGTTTLYNLGWLKTVIYDKRDVDPDIRVISFPSWLNPAFPRKEFERRRASMPLWKFLMFYEGEFSRPPGLIYNNYMDKYREQGGHLVKPFDVPVEWPRYVGIDPGAVNTAKCWLAHDVANKLYYLYRESLEGDKPTPVHAREALQLAKSKNERVISWYVGATSETQVRLDYINAGIWAQEPAVKDVESGIDRVYGLLGEHRLLIFDDCYNTRHELATYARVLDEQGNATDTIKNKEKYHNLDALRYDVIGVTEPQGVLFK